MTAMDEAEAGPAAGGTVLLDRRPSWWALVRPLVSIAIVVLAVWAAARLLPSSGFLRFVKLVILVEVIKVMLVGIAVPLARWLRTRHVLTERHLILRQGVLRRSSHTIPLADVTRFSASAGRIQRLLGAGTFTVESRAGHATVFRNFSDLGLARRQLARACYGASPEGLEVSP